MFRGPPIKEKGPPSLTASTGSPQWLVLPNTSRLLYCQAWQTRWRAKSFWWQKKTLPNKICYKVPMLKSSLYNFISMKKKGFGGMSWFITRCLSLPWPTRKTTNTSGSVRRGGCGAECPGCGWEEHVHLICLLSKCPVATTAKSRKT